MFGKRNDIRQVYYEVWNKIKANDSILDPMHIIIADIIQLHPEYHKMLDKPDSIDKDFTPEMGESNPFLHMGMHIAIREQISNNLPIGIKSYYMKKCKKFEMHDVEHLIMECLASNLWQAQKDQTDFDNLAYMQCIKES